MGNSTDPRFEQQEAGEMMILGRLTVIYNGLTSRGSTAKKNNNNNSRIKHSAVITSCTKVTSGSN